MELDDMAPEVAQEFYPQALRMLHESGLPFMMGGGFALRQYTGMQRAMKDMDVFCSAGDCPRLLKLFSDEGFETELVDARWLAKAFKDGKYVDFIFNNPGSFTPVNDNWYRHATEGVEFGVPVKYISAEDLFKCKIYVQNRLLENSKEVYGWLENGAHFYVCGDKVRLGAAIQTALTEVVQREGGLGADVAADYVRNLKKQRRYLEDVY